MALETAQLLCTTVNIVNDSSITPYKTTHKNRPSAVWARQMNLKVVVLCKLTEIIIVELNIIYLAKKNF